MASSRMALHVFTHPKHSYVDYILPLLIIYHPRNLFIKIDLKRQFPHCCNLTVSMKTLPLFKLNCLLYLFISAFQFQKNVTTYSSASRLNKCEREQRSVTLIRMQTYLFRSKIAEPKQIYGIMHSMTGNPR